MNSSEIILHIYLRETKTLTTLKNDIYCLFWRSCSLPKASFCISASLFPIVYLLSSSPVGLCYLSTGEVFQTVVSLLFDSDSGCRFDCPSSFSDAAVRCLSH